MNYNAFAGIVLNSMHFYPNDTSNAADVAAAQRGYGEFYLLASPFCLSLYILQLRNSRLLCVVN